jgi:hypothetical protein
VAGDTRVSLWSILWQTMPAVIRARAALADPEGNLFLPSSPVFHQASQQFPPLAATTPAAASCHRRFRRCSSERASAAALSRSTVRALSSAADRNCATSLASRVLGQFARSAIRTASPSDRRAVHRLAQQGATVLFFDSVDANTTSAWGTLPLPTLNHPAADLDFSKVIIAPRFSPHDQLAPLDFR